jgi:hypothetical protein
MDTGASSLFMFYTHGARTVDIKPSHVTIHSNWFRTQLLSNVDALTFDARGRTEISPNKAIYTHLRMKLCRLSYVSHYFLHFSHLKKLGSL